MISTLLLANTGDIGYGGANSILDTAQGLMRANATAWNALWNDAVTNQSGLWQGLIGIGEILSVLGLVYASFKSSKDILKDNSQYNLHKIAEFLIPPIFVFLLFLNSGFLLASLVKITRAVSYSEISQLYDAQILGTTIREAMESVGQTQQANMQVRTLFRDCIDLNGEELKQCLADQGKRAGLQEIAERNQNALPGNLARTLCGMVSGFCAAVILPILAR